MKGRRERESSVLKGRRERASGVEEEEQKVMEAKPKRVGLDNGRDNYVTENGTLRHRSRDPALWDRLALWDMLMSKPVLLYRPMDGIAMVHAVM
jgi:hypothetical protein